MSKSKEFLSTKWVSPWRARVYEKAAQMVGHDVVVYKMETTGNDVVVSISGPNELNRPFARRDAELLDRINYNKLTINPLLIPFVWGTRNRRRKEEKPLQARARRRLG